MKVKVWYLKQKCKIMRKYYAFLPAFVTKQLTSAQCHNLFSHYIGNNVFVVAHLCCTSFLKLFSHTIAATQSKIKTIEKMSFTLNCIQSRVIR